MGVKYHSKLSPTNSIDDIGKDKRNFIHDPVRQKGNVGYLTSNNALKIQQTSLLGLDQYQENVDRSLAQITKSNPSDHQRNFLQHISLPASILGTTLSPFNAITLSSSGGSLSVRNDDSIEGIMQGNSSRYSDNYAMHNHYHPHQFYQHHHHHYLLSSIMETNPILQPPKTHSIEDINALVQIVPSPHQQALNPTALKFGYKLPIQANEGQKYDRQSFKAGSYGGYVDAFGTRRLILYNTSPAQKLISRNNNGHDG